MRETTFCRYSGNRGVSRGEVGEDKTVGSHVLGHGNSFRSRGVIFRDGFSPTCARDGDGRGYGMRDSRGKGMVGKGV